MWLIQCIAMLLNKGNELESWLEWGGESETKRMGTSIKCEYRVCYNILTKDPVISMVINISLQILLTKTRLQQQYNKNKPGNRFIVHTEERMLKNKCCLSSQPSRICPELP